MNEGKRGHGKKKGIFQGGVRGDITDIKWREKRRNNEGDDGEVKGNNRTGKIQERGRGRGGE